MLELNEFVLGARMRNSALIFLLFAFPLAVPAQQDKATSPVTLNETQILGRRVFQQRCAICHTESTPGARRYGPVLSKELVDGNEDTIRDFISNGSKGKMPGFKYGLEAPEINAIVEYLKTVPRPAKRGGATQSQDGMLD
jgi:mono/diheme cytochrome c family protein